MGVKVQKSMEQAVHILFSIIFFICTFFTLFHFEKYPLGFQHSTVKTLIFAGAAMLLVKGYCVCIEKSGNKGNLVRILVALILGIVQILLFLKIMTPIGWDVVEVVNSAEHGIYNGYYFARLPQNLLLHLILRGWLKIFDFISFLTPLRIMEILNLFCVDISILMLYFVGKKMYGQKSADRIFAYAVLLIGFHPTLSTIYSDTMAMPYPIGILFFAIYGMESNKRWVKVMCGAGAGIMGIIGFNIKPTAFIVHIAIVIFLILRYRKNIVIKDTVIMIASALIFGIACFSAIYIIEKPIKEQLAIEWPDYKPHSILHYIGIGMSNTDDDPSGYGGYCSVEVEWTHAHMHNPNYKQEALAHIWDRIVEYGPIGYPEHLLNKLIWAGSDGTFFYGLEGGFHLEEQAPQDTVRGFLQNAFYIETDFYQKWFSSWMQGVWFYICLLCTLSIFRKPDNVFNGISKLSVCGLFLFLLIFENRARYLFLFLPVILIAMESDRKFRKIYLK